jgi:hypothetical protein
MRKTNVRQHTRKISNKKTGVKQHFRSLKEKQVLGRIPIKDLTYPQAKKRFPFINPVADYDGDSVINKKDCRPFDEERQDDDVELYMQGLIPEEKEKELSPYMRRKFFDEIVEKEAKDFQKKAREEKKIANKLQEEENERKKSLRLVAKWNRNLNKEEKPKEIVTEVSIVEPEENTGKYWKENF